MIRPVSLPHHQHNINILMGFQEKICDASQSLKVLIVFSDSTVWYLSYNVLDDRVSCPSHFTGNFINGNSMLLLHVHSCTQQIIYYKVASLLFTDGLWFCTGVLSMQTGAWFLSIIVMYIIFFTEHWYQNLISHSQYSRSSVKSFKC